MILDHPIRRALLVAALYLLTALIAQRARRHQVIGAETVQRLMGLLMGPVVLVSANAIPKRLVPLARLSCDPAREQALRRFCGRVLVLGGLGYTLAFVLAPIESRPCWRSACWRRPSSWWPASRRAAHGTDAPPAEATRSLSRASMTSC